MRNKYIKIEDLSKNELLGLIYNHLPRTLYDMHPVFCAACAKGYEGGLIEICGKIVVPYDYVCDDCERD